MDSGPYCSAMELVGIAVAEATEEDSEVSGAVMEVSGAVMEVGSTTLKHPSPLTSDDVTCRNEKFMNTSTINSDPGLVRASSAPRTSSSPASPAIRQEM